jgi:hypothetical protein
MILHQDASPCKEFKCVNGVVELTHYLCPACPVGSKVIQLSWECCPRCIRRKWYDAVSVWNVIRSVAIPYVFISVNLFIPINVCFFITLLFFIFGLIDYGSYRLSNLEIRLTAGVTCQQAMLTPPWHLIPPLIYSEVRVRPFSALYFL